MSGEVIRFSAVFGAGAMGMGSKVMVVSRYLL
jgi:hypothetical protein